LKGGFARSTRDFDLKPRLGDVSDRIENVLIGLDTPDLLASQLPFAIQILKDDLVQWRQ
jgi:hypothetical protein